MSADLLKFLIAALTKELQVETQGFGQFAFSRHSLLEGKDESN